MVCHIILLILIFLKPVGARIYFIGGGVLIRVGLFGRSAMLEEESLGLVEFALILGSYLLEVFKVLGFLQVFNSSIGLGNGFPRVIPNDHALSLY
jgi:hypothetical protein